VSPERQVVGFPLESSPNGVFGMGVGPLQNWKCPISVSNATFYEPAAHVTLVCVVDVLYIGWKLYGMAVQPDPLGSNFTCANPFAALAVMDPDRPAVRSSIDTFRPLEVSLSPT
jgi:hypothetical protein